MLRYDMYMKFIGIIKQTHDNLVEALSLNAQVVK